MGTFRLGWRGISILLFVVLLLAVGWAKHAALLRGAANWWVVSDHLDEPADAIVVLGGGFETRPEAAADLYRRGLGRLILIVNPQGNQLKIEPTEQGLTFTKLKRLGVPSESLVNLGNSISNSYEEAYSVKLWATANAAKTIIIPTDLFHTRRVYWIFTKELGTAGIDVKVLAINQSHYSVDDWWTNRSGQAEFLSEIAKYVFYRIKY